MRHKKSILFYLRKISQGILLSLCIVSLVFAGSQENIADRLFLYMALPCFEPDSDTQMAFKYNLPGIDSAISEPLDEPSGQESRNLFKVEKIEENEFGDAADELIGIHDIIYQTEADSSNIDDHFFIDFPTVSDIDKLRDLSYLRSNFYTVDASTDITPQDFNVDEFLSMDLSIDTSGDDPKVLIFHTHVSEMFIDSDPSDLYEGIAGAGERLCKILNDRGIKTIHAVDKFDAVRGLAYERMEPRIRQILAQNPSIEMIIDLHRDGVNDATHLITNVNGKKTAPIMFFNGLSKQYDNGVLTNIASLPNKNLSANLALSFQLQLAANSLYPGFTRKVYLKNYRYSLHMLPKSILVEVGAQTNTKEEAFNAMEPLADIITSVILK